METRGRCAAFSYEGVASSNAHISSLALELHGIRPSQRRRSRVENNEDPCHFRRTRDQSARRAAIDSPQWGSPRRLAILDQLVRTAGVEPARGLPLRILSPVCLPFPPRPPGLPGGGRRPCQKSWAVGTRPMTGGSTRPVVIQHRLPNSAASPRTATTKCGYWLWMSLIRPASMRQQLNSTVPIRDLPASGWVEQRSIVVFRPVDARRDRPHGHGFRRKWHE